MHVFIFRKYVLIHSVHIVSELHDLQGDTHNEHVFSFK
jgi:hypothetical protein